MGGWVHAPLGRLTSKIGSGATPLGGEAVYQAEGISLIRSLNVHDGEFRSKDLAFLSQQQADALSNVVVQANDVLLNITGASVARCCIVPDAVLPARVNQHVAIVRPLANRLLPKFLQYFLVSRKLLLLSAGEGAGATRQALTKAQLQEFSVSFPDSLQEQARIVAILDEAFEGIAVAKANAERNLRNARELFERNLDGLFSRPAPGWIMTTLENVLAVQPRNGWSPPAENHSDAGTPVLTLSSVTGFRFRADKVKFTSAVSDQQRSYWVQNGDLLMTRSNTPELVGHVAICAGLSEPTIYPDLIMRMVPAPERMVTKFLYYQLRSSSCRREITRRAQGANPTMVKISNGAARTLPIAAPPIESQVDVVAKLDEISAQTQGLASLYAKKLAALDELKKSLLHQAFTGAI